ncbi:ABC transporter [Synergistales bacterium]|nr:ABC transporter [Synergistales bacterium]
MSSTVIKVESLGKKYNLTKKSSMAYGSLRASFAMCAKRAAQKIAHPFATRNSSESASSKDEFWALRDVNFSVEQGEKLGVVGHNGAGKSTLLKVLSRITEPTTGRVSIKGRVSSLLEVGTGFHYELTGRENIFLNGAILGMRQAEIKRNFDAIVEFSGVEQFLDMPIKYYSSGMTVRLAFAVAAFLSTEILIVDEVLAVGDAEFQKKCIGKMDEVNRKDGRTVLFVSHNMSAVASFCARGIMLKQGSVCETGNISYIVARYAGSGGNMGSSASFPAGMHGDDTVDLIDVRIEKESGQGAVDFAITEPIKISMKYRVKKENASLTPGVFLTNSSGTRVLLSTDAPFDSDGTKKAHSGVYIASCVVPGNFLNDGMYSIELWMTTMTQTVSHFYVPNALSFIVLDDMENTPTRGAYRGQFSGAVRPLLEWSSEKISSL